MSVWGSLLPFLGCIQPTGPPGRVVGTPDETPDGLLPVSSPQVGRQHGDNQ